MISSLTVLKSSMSFTAADFTYEREAADALLKILLKTLSILLNAIVLLPVKLDSLLNELFDSKYDFCYNL